MGKRFHYAEGMPRPVWWKWNVAEHRPRGRKSRREVVVKSHLRLKDANPSNVDPYLAEHCSYGLRRTGMRERQNCY